MTTYWQRKNCAVLHQVSTNKPFKWEKKKKRTHRWVRLRGFGFIFPRVAVPIKRREA